MELNKNKILKLESNKKGRDFVVGDLHGCYNALKKLLEKVDFNTKKDRLISVGDLIDRGPDSIKCLELLKKPWFYCVLGNHEDILIKYLENIPQKKPYDEEWLNEMGETYTERRKFARSYLKKLKELPFVLSVGDNNDHFYVVHAELIDRHKRVKKKHVDNWDFVNLKYTEYHAIWGRKVYDYSNKGEIYFPHDNKLSDIYCGHCILEAPVRVGKQIFLDRGAFVPYGNIKFKLNKKSKLAVKTGMVFVPGLIMVNPKEKIGWGFETGNSQIKKFVYY